MTATDPTLRTWTTAVEQAAIRWARIVKGTGVRQLTLSDAFDAQIAEAQR